MKTAVFVCALVALAIGIWAAKVRNGPAAGPGSLRPTVVWTPPRTTIDSSYVTVAGLLLGNGLGDPRGRQFCSMNVALGVADGHPGLFAPAYGWVSPDGKSALLLDGVEYGGISQVVPADLGKVVAALLIDAKEHRPYSSLVMAPAGEYNPALPALLLIADRPDLAEVSYAVSPSGARGDKGEALASWLYDRYDELGAEARLEGNPKEGLEEAKRFLSLAVLKSEIENGSELSNRFEPDGGSALRSQDHNQDIQRPQSFVKVFSVKIAGHQMDFGDTSGIATLDEDARIATLIDGIDTATFTLFKPGTRPPGQVVISTLSGLGDHAIPALLDVLESDQRPIREPQVPGRQRMVYRPAQTFGQNTISYSGQPGTQTAKNVAWSAIQAIWPMCTRWQKPNSDYPDAELLRRHWETDSSLSVPERWLEVLEDDRAGEQLWFQAAETLTKRTATGTTTAGGRQAMSPATLAGDSVRPKHGSEVDSLLAKRCLQITNLTTPNSYPVPNQSGALTLATDLYRWHPAASLECLKAACKCAMVVPKPPPQPPGRPNLPQQPIQYNSSLDGPFAVAIFERSLLGDRSAAADYAAYSTHVSSNSYVGGPPFLAPLWKAPNDAGIQAVGETLIRHWQKDLDGSDANKVIETIQRMIEGGELQRLLLLKSFRGMLARSLANNVALGTATATSSGGQSPVVVNFSIGTSVRASWMGAQGDIAPPGNFAVSTGDFIAKSLYQQLNQGNQGRRVNGCPQFEVYWPTNERVMAKRSMIAWLNDDSQDWLKAVAVLPQPNQEDY